MTEMLNEIEANEIIDRQDLATIQRVKSIDTIEGKDFVELVSFENCGYKAVCEKIHKVGDLVLVVKYDSVVPDIPMFDFMRNSKFRIKQKSFSTATGKIYSQCIVLPIILLQEYIMSMQNTNSSYLIEEQDVTDIIGVKKYILPVKGTSSSFGKMQAKCEFPTHLVNKTDEINIASKPSLLNELNGLPYSITCKLDGASMTCLINPDNDEFEVCSRNNIIKEDNTNSFWIVARKYDIENILRNHFLYHKERLCLQMELVGTKIQCNKMNLSDIYCYVFNIIDIDTRKRIDFNTQLNFCNYNNIRHVPVIEQSDNFNYTYDYLIDNVVKLRYDDFGFNSKHPIEGFVIRPIHDIPSKILKGDTLSFKLINPEF